jgi:hypothetical protein
MTAGQGIGRGLHAARLLGAARTALTADAVLEAEEAGRSQAFDAVLAELLPQRTAAAVEA